MNIVFMGSADFGIASLDAVKEHYSLAAVVSTPAKPSGRGLHLTDSPIVTHARNLGIEKVLTPCDLKSPLFQEELSKFDADLFVVVAFKILPRSVFSLPPLGTVNVHASILPKFRGPAPIQRAIEAGEKETGVTIFRIDEGIDTGELLMQRRIRIGELETTPQLYDRLSKLGAEALIDALRGIEDSSIQPLIQSSEGMTKAPKLSKEEALISWNLPASTIFNRVRAFKPFPGTFTFLRGKRLGIEWGEPEQTAVQRAPATIARVEQNFFSVQCNPGLFRVTEVRPEGKRRMTVGEFLRGTHLTEGESFDQYPADHS